MTTSPLLSQRDLDYARDCALSLMTDICEIRGGATLQDGQGGMSQDPLEIYENVPCRFAERFGQERFLGNRPISIGEWVLTVPWDQALDEKMEVHHRGQVFEVKFVEYTSFMTAKRALVIARD